MDPLAESRSAVDPVLALSRELIEKGSKSFAMAARLLPGSIRDDAVMLYAWCRHCDDEIDDQILGFAGDASQKGSASERLLSLREKTARALHGDAEEPVFIALARLIQKHRIPERHPLDLLRGFQMDVEGRVYCKLDDTLEYCYHVAGVVGAMMAMIMGVRDSATLNRASDLGIAFQLTNIARDVIDDANAGRVYLPQTWLTEAGVPANAIADPAHREAVFQIASRLIGEAEIYYQSALYGMRRLPFGAAIGIGAARRIYRDIGRIVIRDGPDGLSRRAIVSQRRKAAAAVSGTMAALRAHTLLRVMRAPPREGLWTMRNL